jgi:hypothetical protein
MIKTFTQNDLMRYLYQETTEEEAREISKALVCDPQLQSLYMELSTLKNEMDKIKLEPSSSTVLNILSYSKSLQEKRL